jgi:hypothetical protein
VVSAHSSRENFKEYLKLRLDAFIEKPFRTDEVSKIARQAVRESDLRTAILSLSRLSFRAFVSSEKILSLPPLTDAVLSEKEHLNEFMQDIRSTTTKLFASERALKP